MRSFTKHVMANGLRKQGELVINRIWFAHPGLRFSAQGSVFKFSTHHCG